MNIPQDTRNSIALVARNHDREQQDLSRIERIDREDQLIDAWLRLYAIEQGINPFPTTIHHHAPGKGVTSDGD